MKVYKKACLLTGIMAMLVGGTAHAATLLGIRATNEIAHTRIVLDLKKRSPYWDVKYSPSKDRLKIILPNTSNDMKKPIAYSQGNGLLKGVSIIHGDKNSLILSLQASQAVQHNIFALSHPDRLVVDLFTNYEQKTSSTIAANIEYTRWSKSISAGRVQAYVVTVTDGDKVAIGDLKKGMALTKWQGSQKSPVLFPIESTYNSSAKFSSDAYLANTSTGMKILFVQPSFQVHIGKRVLPISAINHERLKDELVLYTSAYGTSTKTNPYGRELLFSHDKVVKITTSNSPITYSTWVLSGHGKMAKALNKAKVGDTVKIVRVEKKPSFDTSATIRLYGQPILENGKYVGPSLEDSETARMSRSFVATTSNGRLLLVAVQGHSSRSSGVTLREGAKLLTSIGVIDAVAVESGEAAQLVVKGKNTLSGSSPNKVYHRVLVIG